MKDQFLCGVVEGFYGRPWTFAQRHRLVDWLKQFGLNTYCYAPKDDLKHRVLWREQLDSTELADFEKLISECRDNGIQFVYGISPGWDDHFSASINSFDPRALIDDLKPRLEQLLKIGCRSFAVQFDDVPNLSVEQRRQLARWHAETCNELYQWASDLDPNATLIMCPAIYCSAMAEENISRCDYLKTLGAELQREVHIFWTGPDIISRSITTEHLYEINDVLNRRPLIWDNLNANDYDPARPQMGPYSNRSSDLLKQSRGILINPNCQFELNFVPLYTLGSFVETGTSAVETAVEAWLPEWERIAGEAFSEKLVQRVVECFWLPHHSGPFGVQLLENARRALQNDKEAIEFIRTAAAQFGKLFFDLGALRNRELLDALWSPIWRLKDELELIAQLAAKARDNPVPLTDFPTGVVRGGMISRLQELIETTETGYQVRR